VDEKSRAIARLRLRLAEIGYHVVDVIISQLGKQYSHRSPSTSALAIAAAL
jgi:hypothetical protein